MLVALLACLVLCGSCATVSVWGGRLEHGGDVTRVGWDDGPFEDLSWPARLPVTPLALLLDACTWPVQEVLHDRDDDGDDDC